MRKVLRPDCSLCITHFNDAQTIRQSLDGILNQLDDSFEVVVVDQKSDDGSRDILQKYADKDRIRLFDMSIRNRGLGRQMAFEKSTGEYVIANINLDIFYQPVLAKLLRTYKRMFEPKVFVFDHLEVARRDVVERIGGWRDLQWGEDTEHMARAARAGMLVSVQDVPAAYWIRPFGRNRSRWQMVKYRYEMMRDLRRMGRRRWPKVLDSPTRVGKASMVALMLGGTIGAVFRSSYRDSQSNSFALSDYAYKQDFRLLGESD